LGKGEEFLTIEKGTDNGKGFRCFFGFFFMEMPKTSRRSAGGGV